MNSRQILKLLKEGESEKVEFKRRVTGDLGEEICAFANVEGGIILIGIDDSGEVVGCDTKKSKKDASQFANSVTPPPRLRFHDVPFGNLKILAIEVVKSKMLCSLGGVVYIRVGSSKRPLSIQEILSLGAEQLLFEMDKIPTDVSASEINKLYLNQFLKQRERRGLERIEAGRLLKNLGAVTKKNGRVVLSLAGLLFFHKHPQAHMPHSFARVVVGEGWKRFEGPAWKIVEDVYEYLLASFKRIPLVVGARREDYLEYPPRALREALVNAITHRNYSIYSEIFAYVEPDKLRVINPGGFPPGTSVEDPRPVPRNPLLYELMFQSGYVERQGRGIQLIIEECKKHPFVNVEFKVKPNFTEIIFYKKPAKGLSDAEAKIYTLLGAASRSSSQLAAELNVSKVTVLRKLKKLSSLGLIKAEGAGAQRKYRVS
jgi:ATP-dependent DNA helicase RecG